MEWVNFKVKEGEREKLKNKWFDERYYSPDVDFDDFIDTLLKEMVGEEE